MMFNYKCLNCQKQFLGGTRIDNIQLWKEYIEGKQTYSQLANKHSCSIKTIQRRLDKVTTNFTAKKPRAVIVFMDTTYWSRNFGVMLFKDALTKENLLKYYVKYETNSLYIQGVLELKDKGHKILAIVCDGRKGLPQSFGNIPAQMCQFHQSAIIRRYLTKRPKLTAAKEFMEVVDLMKQTDKESFTGALDEWFNSWKVF
jgi:DNA-directed RNA polymerase subunit RPC12/RpoP